MKRDMELCRKIMILIEDASTNEIYPFHVEGYSDETVKYHCDLLRNQGFLENCSEDILGNLSVGELTWEGQDFIDKIRDDTFWNRVKKEIKRKGLELTFEIIKMISIKLKMKLKDVKNISDLIGYLETKGNKHNDYYHYTTLGALNKIKSSKHFLLTKGNAYTLNDQQESTCKGSVNEWEKTYIGSFAFGSSENMAMWGLYGLPWDEAVRIAIPGKAMRDWINNINVVSAWNEKEKRLEPIIDHPEPLLADIVYVTDKGKYITLNRGDEHLTVEKDLYFKNINNNSKLTGFIKNYAWHYENEVRIRVKLPRPENYNKIAIEIPDEIINSFSITTGPYFDEKANNAYKPGWANPSEFQHLVNFKSICSMCKHKNFEREE